VGASLLAILPLFLILRSFERRRLPARRFRGRPRPSGVPSLHKKPEVFLLRSALVFHAAEPACAQAAPCMVLNDMDMDILSASYYPVLQEPLSIKSNYKNNTGDPAWLTP
jgi:hypothetical protein